MAIIKNYINTKRICKKTRLKIELYDFYLQHQISAETNITNELISQLCGVNFSLSDPESDHSNLGFLFERSWDKSEEVKFTLPVMESSAKQLQLVLEGIALFAQYNRTESVLANEASSKEMEKFLNGFEISVNPAAPWK